MTFLHKAILGALLLTIVGMGMARAGGDVQRDVFTRTHGHGSITRVVFRHHCLDAEDSAGHLVLRGYGDGVATYGCARRGY
jgi:hypothetical protein